MLILLCISLSFKCRTLPCNGVFPQCGIHTFTQVFSDGGNSVWTHHDTQPQLVDFVKLTLEWTKEEDECVEHGEECVHVCVSHVNANTLIHRLLAAFPPPTVTSTVCRHIPAEHNNKETGPMKTCVVPASSVVLYYYTHTDYMQWWKKYSFCIYVQIQRKIHIYLQYET